MKKRVCHYKAVLIPVILGSLFFFCNVFEDVAAPEKTEISAVFEGSDGKIYDGYFVDSAGKEIGIGAALYLPVNFDSITIEVVDSGITVINSTVRRFNDDYFKDTVWIRHTFMYPGLKNVTITPYASPERSPVTSRIVIEGSAQNTAPQWSVDTLRRTVKVGNPLYQSLSEICVDRESDEITFTLVSGAPANDTIVNSVYQFIPTEQDVGVQVAQIIASDPVGNTSSTLPVVITILSSTGDPQPEYRVVYDGNGYTDGTVPADTNKYTSSSTVIVKDNSGLLMKTGSTFAGWNTAADGSGTSYVAGAVFSMGSKDVILYAQWTLPTPFKVTYNGNAHTAGAPPVDNNQYETGTLVTVKGNTGNMVKVGFTFAGWNTAADGSGTTYASGVTFPMGIANVTLYAQWTTMPTFTVTYHGNGNTGGSVPSDANNYITGAVVTAMENAGALVKAEVTFIGWNTAADGSGTSYAPGATFPMGSVNVMLYAQWTSSPTYTITYDGNGNTGGTVPVDANSYQTAANVTVKGNTGLLEKTGATFTGWNTAADGSGTLYAAGVTFPMADANVILYALWTTTPSYTITFDSNGGSGTMAAQSIVSGMSAPLTANVFTKSGSVFAGWVTTPAGTTVEYADMSIYSMGNNNIILYALWSQNPSYKVTFISNGGTGTMADQPIVSGMTVPLVANTFIKPGSTFAGWVTSQTGTAAEYIDKAPYTMGANDVILYAFWTQNPSYTITFDKNGGNGTMAAQSIVSGLSAPLAANTFTNAGSTFAGWNTAAGGNGTSYAAGATFTMGDADVTLYAQWRAVWTETDRFSAGGTLSNVILDQNENIYFVQAIADELFVQNITTNGSVTNVASYPGFPINGIALDLGNDGKTIFVACLDKIVSWNGSSWTLVIDNMQWNSVGGLSMKIGSQNRPYVKAMDGEFKVRIRRLNNGNWDDVGGDVDIPQNPGGSAANSAFCLTSTQAVFTIGRDFSSETGPSIANLSGTVWNFVDLDGPTTAGWLHVIAHGNNVYAGFTEQNSDNPSIYRWSSGSWTKLPSMANSTTALGGFSMAFSPSGELFAGHVEGVSAVIKKYNGSTWQNVHTTSGATAFTVPEESGIQLVPTSNACYAIIKTNSEWIIWKLALN